MRKKKRPENWLEPPEELSPEAKQCWFRYAPLLRREGLFEPPDTTLFRSVCVTAAEIQQFQKMRREEPENDRILRKMERDAARSLTELARILALKVHWVERTSIDIEFAPEYVGVTLEDNNDE